MTNCTHDTSDRAIAIIGLGSRFPGAPDLPSFWRTLQERQVHTRPIPRSRWNHDLFYSPRALKEPGKTYANRLALVDAIEHMAPEFFGLTARRAKVMDPQQRLFLDATRMALEDAGYGARPFPRERTGVFVGAAVSDFRDILVGQIKAALFADGIMGHGLSPASEVTQALTRDLAPLQAYSLVGQALNMVAANVSQCFEFGGGAFTTDSACSSALVALHEATLHLRSGICDAAVVGGVHAILVPDGVVAFTRIGAISASNACRPFDRRADGFVMGEGAGAILLKRLPDALRDGDRIYAVIRGIAMNNDGRAEGPMTPRLEGQVAVLDRACADAGISPRTVDFIEAHGTATPVGDATEVAALFYVREESAGTTTRAERPCALSSVKANLGHCMTASGAAGLIRAALSLDRKRITPHAGYSEPRPELELAARGFFIPEVEQDFVAPTNHPRRAGLNSFGFGGTNVHVVLEEAPPRSTRPRTFIQVPAESRAEPRRAPRAELFILSGATDALLAAYAVDLARCVRADPSLAPRDLAYTLASRRQDPVRAAFLAADRETLLARLDALGRAQEDEGLIRSKGPIDEPPTIAFLFPGQGAQAPGLARDLYERVPSFRRTLDELCAAHTPGNRPLLEYLYPESANSPSARKALTATEICQPIMAALGLAHARVLRELGIEPAAVLGHSLGEFAAAACAGLFSARTAVRLVGARGALIAGLPLSDRGAMAALACDRARAEELIADLPDVAIANINHPNQIVLSGTTPALEAALTRATTRGIKTRRLDVSHAFHSPLMAGLRGRFEALLDNTPFGPTDIPLVSAIVPGRYPADADAARAILSRHATATVDFVGGLRALSALGTRIFLQMGAGRALATMARHTLGAELPEAMFESASAETPDDGHTFLTTLARLFVAGASLRLQPLFEDEVPQLVTLPATRLDTRPLWPVKQTEVHPPLQVLLGSTQPIPMTAFPAPLSSPVMNHETKPETTDPPRPSPHLPSERPPAPHPLGALFDRQLALMDAQLEILREQNRLLAREGTAVVQATEPMPAIEPPVSAPASVPSPPRTPLRATPEAPSPPPQPAHLQPTHLEEVAREERLRTELIEAATRITASPPGRILGSTRLVADLGFDSLMVAELITAMSERHPGLELPRALFAGDISIERLSREIAAVLPNEPAGSVATGVSPAAVADGTTKVPPLPNTPLCPPAPAYSPAATPSGTTGFERRPVVLASRPLSDASLLPIAGPVRVIGDERLASEVCAALRKRASGFALDLEAWTPCGPDDDVADEDLRSLPAGACVVDLRGLRAQPAASEKTRASSEQLRAPALRVLRTLRALGQRRPARYVLFHDGGVAIALEGLAKALAAEWPMTTVRTIELPGAHTGEDPAVDLAARVDCIAREVATVDATLEIRYAGTGQNGARRLERFSPTLGDALVTPLALSTAPLRDAVVVVTGGARGIGAQIAHALAVHGARLALLGRSPADADTEALLHALATGGGSARYCRCDVTRPEEVEVALTHIRATLGPVRFVVHAAGLIEDAALADKDPASFARVFDTKVAGALNLWQAVQDEPLSVFLALGSLAGRYGNTHQIDYASANNTLARLCEVFAAQRPEVASLVLALPPWQGSGMLARLPEAARQRLAQQTGIVAPEDGLGAFLATLLTGPQHGVARLGSNELVLCRTMSRAAHPPGSHVAH